MDNRIITSKTEETDQQKQIKFMKELAEEPRKKAKNALMKKVDQAIEAIVELKADLVTNGITACIYDFDYNDTDIFFKPFKEAIDHMDFIIETETRRITDIALTNTSEEMQRMEKRESLLTTSKEQKEADIAYNEEIKRIRNENGTITLDY